MSSQQQPVQIESRLGGGVSIHSIGWNPVHARPAGLVTSTRERVAAFADPGYEQWAAITVRDFAPRSKMPADWPDAPCLSPRAPFAQEGC